MTTDKANPAAGDTVTLTITPDAANYVLGSIRVTKEVGSGYKQTVLDDSLIILGIDERGFITKNGKWGTSFYRL